MKKHMFLVVLLVMLSFGLFTACNSKASIKGDFKKSEYTISLSNAASPSEINFLNEFDVVGVEPANVKFVSSNEKVLAPKNVAGVFEGVASGDAYVFARINDKNIAKAKVYVKYKFSKPQNLKMTDGVLTFDPSYVIKKGGEQIFAQKYELKYKLNGDEEKNLIIENGQTSYTFIDKGIYDISLNALAQDNDKIDASEANSGKFTLGVMMPVSETDFSYTCSESVLNTITVFTWECDEENAKFDVYIDGLRVEKDLTRKEFRYDFNAYAGGEEITIKIVTKDGEGKRDDSSSDFKFKILTTPTVDYVYNGEDGYITWNNNDNVTKYIVSIYNENLSLYEDAQEVAPGEGLKEYLEWLYEGIYKVNVMAVGGTKNGLNYLNSKLSKDLEVGKIVAREPEVTLEGSTAKIKFQGDQYVTKYRISCEGKEKIYDTTQGDTTTFILPQLEVGEHYLQFTALPTPDQNSETNVKAFIFGSKAVMRVINSDPLPYKFYKLADFEDNIEHNLRGDTSIISFDPIENANYYEIYIKDKKISELSTSSTERITMTFDNLKNEELNYDLNGVKGYDLKIIAGTRENGIDIAILSEGHKILTILPTVKKSSNQTNGYFSWELVQNADYQYVIYKTDSLNEGRSQYVGPITTEGTQIMDELIEEGYYVIEIASIPKLVNEHLASNFKDAGNIATFSFIVTKKIEVPEVIFSEEGGLHLDMMLKEHTGKVNIYIIKDGQPVENGNPVDFPAFEEFKGTIKYDFEYDFRDAIKYEIKVVSSGGSLYDNVIYTESEPTTISVTRIAQPTISVEDNIRDSYDNVSNMFNSQMLKIEECKGSQNAIVKLNDITKLSEGYQLDLFDQSVYGGNFTLNITLEAQQPNGNEYYISSIPKDYKFRRITTPSKLVYKKGIISWENSDDQTEDYYIMIALVNSYASNYSRRFFLSELDPKYYSPPLMEYDFQQYINDILTSAEADDRNFASVFRQSGTNMLDIELIAYKNGDQDGTYILCSANATTASDGSGTLHIKTLAAPTLEFDRESETISWGNVAKDCYYDIYVDDVRIKDSYKNLSIQDDHEIHSIKKDAISEDYLSGEGRKIKIVARHDECLDSSFSETIYIKKLTSPQTVKIGVEGVKYNLIIPLTDSTHTQNVKLNDTAITFRTGDINASKELIDDEGEQKIVFEAIEYEGNNYYYLDSDAVTINLSNLENLGFGATTEGNAIKWSELCSGLKVLDGEEWPLRYKLEIENGGNHPTLEYSYKTEISLEDLEEAIYQMYNIELSGAIKIIVSASIISEYSCSLSEVNAIYYGTCSQKDQLTFAKLQSVGEIKVNAVNDGDFDKKLKSKLKISFDDLWTDSYPEGIYFIFTFDNLKLPNDKNSVTFNASDVLNGQYDSFKKEDREFIYTLDFYSLAEANGQDYLINPGETTVRIQVCRDGSVNADETSQIIRKFEKPKDESIRIDANGLLTIDPLDKYMGNATFSVEVRCGGEGEEPDNLLGVRDIKGTIDGPATLDLMEEGLLKGRSGEYKLRILVYEEDNNILPSAVAYKVGYKLKGIESIEIDKYEGEYGIIDIQLIPDENLSDRFVFEATENNITKQFVPSKDEETDGLYHYSLLDMLYLFDEKLSRGESDEPISVELTVRADDSIKATPMSVEFYYKVESPAADLKRVNSLDKDYIVYAPDGSIPTAGFVVDITFTQIQIVENLDEEGGDPITEEKLVTIRKCIPANEAHGFWLEDKGLFVKELGGESNYSECYAICIDDILNSSGEMIEGDFKIKISRVGKKDGKVYQYNPTDFKDLYRLKSMLSVSISNNRLNISWLGDLQEEKAPSQYIIYFREKESGETIGRYYTAVSTIDLRGINFIDPGIEYEVEVKALNSDPHIIGSVLSSSIIVKRYRAPMAIEIEDGKLMFNKNDFIKSDFFTDIEKIFGNDGELAGTAYWQHIAETRNNSYSGPIDFTIGRLAEQRVILEFTRLESHESYKVYIPAYKLFPDAQIYTDSGDQSYITILKNYANSVAQLEPAQDTVNMIGQLAGSCLGVGDDGDLFDDYFDEFRRNIPAGEYKLSVYQADYMNNIESRVSENTITVYISPAPTGELKVGEGKDQRANYYAEFRPEATMYYDDAEGIYKEQKTAKVYKMAIRRIERNVPTTNNLIELLIKKDDDNWHIYKEDDTELLNVVETLENGNFKVNMTQLRKEINDKNLKFNETLRVDVYACAKDDEMVINGKSSTFNVTYLDLSSTNIQFDNGVIRVGKVDFNCDLLVKYQLETGELTSKTFSFEDENDENNDGGIKINLEEPGRYQSILISLSGSSSKDSLVVESLTYLIAGKQKEDGSREGVYKLHQPNLTTQENKIYINFDEKDLRRTSLMFYMGNDISLSEDGEQSGYYYQSTFNDSTDNGQPYIVGALEGGIPKYPSELKASIFYAYLGGNVGSFTVEECTDFIGAEYVLKLYNNGEEISPILKSDRWEISARMLNAELGYNIEKGDVSISYNNEDAPKIYDRVEVEGREEGALIYEIRISYYLNNTEEESFVFDELYYSEISPLATQIPGLTFNTNYDYYRMKVTVYGAKYSSIETEGAVKSIQGNYFYLGDSVYFEDGAQVLMSTTLQTDMFTKTHTPYLESKTTGAGVSKGEIVFMVDNTVYVAGENNSEKLSVYADYETVNGDEKTILLEGEFTFNQSPSEQDKIKVVFIPDEGQLNDASGDIVLRIYAFGEASIISSPLRIYDVYKLKNITEIEYEVKLEQGNTVIDLTKYFENNQIRGNNSCYKIAIETVDKDDVTEKVEYSVNSGDKKFIVLPKHKKLTMQVIDAQEESEINARKLLHSDRNILNIEVTSTEGISFTWNDTLKRFEWEWSGETLSKEYYISMYISNKLESDFTTDLYYMPKKMGRIPAPRISLRMRNLGEQASTLYIYSEAVGYTGKEDEINYDIFEVGGEGSREAPYEIIDVTEFKNMSLRNANGIFFKINENLIINTSDMLVEGKHLFEEFYASIDGADHTITVNCDTVFTTEEEIFNFDGVVQMAFSQYSSLFKKIMDGASISNLNINLEINNTSLQTSNIMYAPLAYENNGNIEEVFLMKADNINLSGDGVNNVFIGGLVGINTASIINCEVDKAANIDYTSPQKLNVNIAFAGIALINRSGTIENCFNRSNISLKTASTLETNFHIAGITLFNVGEAVIAFCGNEGTFTFSADSRNSSRLNCYGGGIAINSSGGTLKFLYNNGAMSRSGGGSGSNLFGGIAQTISGGLINTLVNTVSGQKMALRVTGSLSKMGTNYGIENASDIGNLSVKGLKETVTLNSDVPGDSRKLHVQKTDDRFIASINY